MTFHSFHFIVSRSFICVLLPPHQRRIHTRETTDETWSTFPRLFSEFSSIGSFTSRHSHGLRRRSIVHRHCVRARALNGEFPKQFMQKVTIIFHEMRKTRWKNSSHFSLPQQKSIRRRSDIQLTARIERQHDLIIIARAHSSSPVETHLSFACHSTKVGSC